MPQQWINNRQLIGGGVMLLAIVGAVIFFFLADTPEPTDKIAFYSDHDGNSDIYVMNADGSGQINLTNSPADDFSPAWGP